MFTVLSRTRKINPYLMGAIAIMVIVATALVAVPSTAAPKSAIIPVTDSSEWPDYYQRHPQMHILAGGVVDTTDYFFRHPELRATVNSVDLTDYIFRHPGLSATAKSRDLTDYFQRHPDFKIK